MCHTQCWNIWRYTGTEMCHTRCGDIGCMGTGTCHTRCPPLALPGGELCAQGDVTMGRDAAPVGQVTGGAMGTAVHLVLAARCLRAPDPVTTVAAAGRCPPRARLHTCGMGQHPQEPSGVTQQVALLGHSDVPSGHRSADTAATPARARARARRSVTVVLMAQGTPAGGSAPTARPCLSFPPHSAGLGSAPHPRLSLPLSFLWGWWKTPAPPPLQQPPQHPAPRLLPLPINHSTKSRGQGAACQGGP